MLGCDTSFELIRHVALPAAVPAIASGVRIAMGVGWMCLVAAEMFGVSTYGLGYQLWHNYYLHQMPNVVVYMLILGFTGSSSTASSGTTSISSSCGGGQERWPEMSGVSVANVGKAFPKEDGTFTQALEGVNLEIGDTEFICLVGPSGGAGRRRFSGSSPDSRPRPPEA